MSIYFKPSHISIKGQGELNKENISFNINLLKNNILTFKINAPKLKYNNELFDIDLKGLNLSSAINLNYDIYNVNGKTKQLNFKYKKISINADNANFLLNNKKITLNSNNLIINNIKNINKVMINNLNGSYNIKNNFLILNSPEIQTQYKNFKFHSYKNSLIFQNLHNLNFNSRLIKIDDNKNKLFLKRNLINILGDYTYISINNGEFVSDQIKLTSTPIIGDLTQFIVKKIYGSIYGFNTSVENIKTNIKDKTVFIKNAYYNNVKAYDITYKNNVLTLHSNDLFNKNIKDVLYKFLNTDIPVTQIAGQNNILSKIMFSDNINSFTKIVTTSSLLKLFDFDLYVPQAEINITNQNLNFTTKKANLYLTKEMPLTFTGSGFINFLNQTLSMNGKIDFKINNIIKLKDYNETAEVNFTSKKLKTKNSNIFIDFDKKQLIINPISKILKYTSFKPFVKNGILLITFGKTTDVTAYILLKLPILFKHSNAPIKKVDNNLNKLFLNIIIGDNIKIYNENINIEINKSNINASLHSLDINLYPLEKLLEDNSSVSNDFNYTINLYTNNANLIYKTHKFLSQTATLTYKKDNFNFHSIYKDSSLNGYTKQGYLLLEGKNFSNEEFKAFLPKFDFFSLINLDFVMVKSPDDFYSGKIYINRAIVRELKSLNNVIAFINTIPSLLSFSSPGFSSKGYKIKNGYINYLLYKKILYIKQAKILGDNLDFYAKGYIDFNKNYMFLKITANMKMKLKKIPIIGKGLSYLLFGKDGSIDIKMVVKGNLDNPKVKEDIGKDILMSPFKLFKRAITLPFNLF
ncbi:conserved hypothetical protein [Nautilia profundicola AmH]|uniref:YhdP central domain-containing protein n=1 Tax=Nautilia profundicola (strain ATCC BAA-1463 / DSM 18972 / AmH) TaxID=598659 RepID=B9L5J2_NAUPA|nr:conserved hypothetical protein [Nautilia profundicola AmH]